MKAGYKQTEVGVVPDDWDVETIGELCEYRNGVSLEAYFNHLDGFKVISIGNYSPEGRFVETNTFIGKEYLNFIRKYILGENELTMILNDKTSVGTIIGKVLLIDRSNAYVYNQRTMRLSPRAHADSAFLYHLINSDANHARIVGLAKPGTQIYVNTNDILEFKLAIPKMREQIAIAALLSDVDELIQSLEKLIAKKRLIKQGAMQELLTGKKRLSGCSGAWRKTALGNIGKFSKGRGIKKDEVSLEGLACIRYGEIYTCFNSYVKNCRSFISQDIAMQSLKIKKGDLLFAGSGETAEEIGKCVAFLGEYEAYAGGDIIVFTPQAQDSMYLGYLMNHTSVTTQKAKMGQGDAVVHISARNLGQIEFWLPPIDEQQRISTTLFNMDAELAALEAKLDKYRQIKKGMVQELLTGRIRLV